MPSDEAISQYPPPQSSRTRRREAESPIRDLPEEAWDIDQRPSEGALISFVGTKERGSSLQAGSMSLEQFEIQYPSIFGAIRYSNPSSDD
jgi:hypothetical protein